MNILVRRSPKRAEYKHHRKFQTSVKRVFDVLGEEMILVVNDEVRSAMNEAGMTVKNPAYIGEVHFVWFLEMDGEGGYVGIDVDPRRQKNGSLWFCSSSESSEAADEIVSKLNGKDVLEARRVDSEQQKVTVTPVVEEEDDDDDDEDEGVSFEVGDIVELNGGSPICLVKKFDPNTETWTGTKPNGYSIKFKADAVTDMMDSATAYDQIVEEFDLDPSNMDGSDGNEYNIARYQGRLVQVNDVDGEDFSICIDREWVSLGEGPDEIVADGRLSRDGEYQQGEDIEIVLKSGATISGVVRGLSNNLDQGLVVDFSGLEEADIDLEDVS